MNLLTHTMGRTIKQEIDLASQQLVGLRNMCGISPVAIMQANRDSMSMSRRDMLGSGDCRISDIRDSAGPSQDAEIVIGIYNPFRDKIANYRGYDIKQLQDVFRSITVLKIDMVNQKLRIAFVSTVRSGCLLNHQHPTRFMITVSFKVRCGHWNQNKMKKMKMINLKL